MVCVYLKDPLRRSHQSLNRRGSIGKRHLVLLRPQVCDIALLCKPSQKRNKCFRGFLGKLKTAYRESVKADARFCFSVDRNPDSVGEHQYIRVGKKPVKLLFVAVRIDYLHLAGFGRSDRYFTAAQHKIDIL